MKINYKIFIILILCSIIFIHFIFIPISNIKQNKIRKVEGMGSPGENNEYVYYPKTSVSEIKFPLRLNNLKFETYEAAEFLKMHKGLIHEPKAPSPKPMEVKTISPAEAEADRKDDAEVGGQLNEMENKLESMIDMSKYNSEYSKDVNTSELYKTYNDFVTNVTNELNKDFEDIFLTENLDKNKIDTLARFKEKIEYYDKAYSAVKHFLKSSKNPSSNDTYINNEFSGYWIHLLEKYAESQSTLDEIKNKFYSVIKHTYIFTRLCNYYKENKKMFNTKDDALLIVNIAIQTIKESKYDELKANRDNIVYSVEKDKEDYNNKVLKLDYIQYTDIASIVYPIVLFIAYNVNNYFGSDFNLFKTKYEEYMKKKNINSFYLFLMNNPPQFSK